MIEMNNVADHVHILFDLHRTEALANVVMHVKKGTSRWLKEHAPQFAGFDWQDGYGASRLANPNGQKQFAICRTSKTIIEPCRFRMSFASFCTPTKSNMTSATFGIEHATAVCRTPLGLVHDYVGSYVPQGVAPGLSCQAPSVRDQRLFAPLFNSAVLECPASRLRCGIGWRNFPEFRRIGR